MAALRVGVKTVLIPEDNMADLEEIDPLVRKQLNFKPIRHVDELLQFVFEEKENTVKSRNAARLKSRKPYHRTPEGTMRQ